MKKLLTVLGIALLSCALFANGATETTATPAKAGTAGEKMLFRVSMPEASTDNKALAIKQVVENIEKRTEGRVSFEVYYSGELGNFTDTIEGISLGSNIIDGTSGDAYAPYGCPDMTALNLMYLYPDSDSVMRFNDSDLFKQMCAELEAKSGIKMICMNWCGAPREVLSTKPINSVKDLKGIMIRVPLPPYVSFFKRLGCSTVQMTMAEVYTGMQQGMLDACEFPLGTIFTNSLQEVAKYCYLSSHTFAPTCWGMSGALFNKLSKDDQAIFVEEFSKGGEYFTQLNKSNMADYQKKLEAAGVKFVEPSEEDKKVMAAAASDAVKDFPELSAGLVDKLLAAMAKK
jgi:TRAP-type C4-dicarboxylate transport system substrate-binding protein